MLELKIVIKFGKGWAGKLFIVEFHTAILIPGNMTPRYVTYQVLRLFWVI